VIDDPAVDLFWYAIIEAAIPCFHMKHGNAPTSGDDRGQAAIGVAKDQNLIRLLFHYRLIYAVQDLSYLVSKAFRTNAEVNVRRPHIEIPNEDITQTLVIILASMQGYVIAMLIKYLQYQAKPYDLGTRPKDCKNFHILEILENLS
jgi:hypothetical protein